MWLDFLNEILPSDLNPNIKLLIHILILVQLGAFFLYLIILTVGHFSPPADLKTPAPRESSPAASKHVDDKAPSPIGKTKKEK